MARSKTFLTLKHDVLRYSLSNLTDFEVFCKLYRFPLLVKACPHRVAAATAAEGGNTKY